MLLKKSRRIKILMLSSLISVLTVFSVFAESEINTETSVSWLTGDVTITATARIPESTTNITSERFRITESIDRNLTAIVTEAFSSIYLDSLHTLEDGFSADSRMMGEFDTLNLRKTRISSSMGLRLDTVTNIYKYNIFEELVPILTSHTKAGSPPEIISYEPTAEFSGIIIYAADPLPFYGENESGSLVPAIFPKIFDTNMDIVASAGMTDPEYLQKWGFILYTDSFDEKQYEERIGLYPFRTTAEGIFGNNRTDILITEEAAKKILYNKSNLRLINEGRIVVIISE